MNPIYGMDIIYKPKPNVFPQAKHPFADASLLLTAAFILQIKMLFLCLKQENKNENNNLYDRTYFNDDLLPT